MERALATQTTLIAPCGLNCRLCRAYMREKNPCPGCRVDSVAKPKTRVLCHIKTCEKRLKEKIDYCFECDEFPCDPLIHLDNRYKTKYGTSVVANLTAIKDLGMRRFIENENKKWACHQCGSMLCMHEPICLTCGHAWKK